MQTADAIIDGLGGTSAVASALNLTPSTVHSWRTANSVPAWRRPAVLSLAEERGVPLSDQDFPVRSRANAPDRLSA